MNSTALNVDSIALVDHLWKEPAAREALVANATEFAKANSELPTIPIEDDKIIGAVDYFNLQFEGLNLPLDGLTNPCLWNRIKPASLSHSVKMSSGASKINMPLTNARRSSMPPLILQSGS